MAKVGSLLCASVGADSLRELTNKASMALSMGSDLVELRIDRLKEDDTPREIEAALSDLARRAIVTVRSRREGGSYAGGEAERLGLISRLAAMRPAYVDVELATAKANRKWAGSLPRDVERIVSWHDFEGTPSLKVLLHLCDEELGLGSMGKVVTTACEVDDNLTTLALCRERPGRVVSFCMGELGTVSRVVSMRLGAPLAYASLPDEAVAPGQLSISVMRSLRSMVA
jgi:3-dehydroquinate dehydratase type I